VRHRTVSVAVRCAISFLLWRIRPLQICGSRHTRHCPVHTGQSGAPYRPSACPRVARGLRGRPLAQSTVGSPESPVAPPDSPVNFSHTPLNVSREQRLHRGRLTGQSGAPPDSPVIYSRTPPSSPKSGLFTETGLAHRTLSGAPPDSPVHPDRAGAGNSFPIAFLLFLALRHNTLVPKSMY
jgi:hypothetical protein